MQIQNRYEKWKAQMWIYISIYVKFNRDYYVVWRKVESIMCGCVDSADRAELGAAAATHGLSAGEGPALRPATPHLNCC